MTAEKVIEVCRLYQDRLAHQELITDLDHHLVHVLEMLPKLIQFAEDGRIEKAFHWLGFIQGVLWCEGIYTIDEMKRHNMPDAEVK